MSFHGVVLESATLRTLHAHGFSRSSTQASLVLTDLLSRYMTLLSATCAKYAQHAGRTGLTARDALCALDELGVGMGDLSEYCISEGRELRRFAVHTARKVEDLNELKAQNADGLKQDRDDVVPLVFAPLSRSVSDESDEDENEEIHEHYDDGTTDDMVVDLPMPMEQITTDRHPDDWVEWRPSTPPLPLSSISNPPSPARKRPRTSNWRPPSHIPQFLPPFPEDRDSTDHHLAPPPHIPLAQQLPPARVENLPSTIPQPLASTLVPDYITRVPYSQSTLSAIPEWHLPSSIPPVHPSLQTKPTVMSTPQTGPSLISAYHHILTHPPPPNGNSANPARHKVAMALLSQTQHSSRWEPPDTMFSSISPCVPRVAAMSPTFPVPIGKTPPTFMDAKVVKVEDNDPKFPATPGKFVSFYERLSPSINQQSSRIPDLARLVLSTSVHSRTTRLTHPSALISNGEKLFYGPGVPAPWNANAAGVPTAVAPTLGKSKECAVNGISNDRGKEPAKVALQDAMLFATWDYDKKDFKQPLVLGRRGRMGSAQGGPGGVLSLARGRSGSKVG